MVSPTDEDQQNLEESSASELDNENVEDTSTSEQSEDELSTFDLVKQAIDPDGEDEDENDERGSEEDESDDPEGDKSKDEDQEGEEDESDEPSEEELKRWKPKTRKRFEDLQAKYRDASERLEKAESEAGYYRQFVDFLDTNRISQEEANQLFNIGALMKNDPARALELITPYYNELLHVTGNVLPPDLQQQVKQGYLTQAHALEISRSRAMGQTNQAIEQERNQYESQRSVRQQQEAVGTMQNALAAWEQKWSSSDPDYNIKKDRVLDRVELMLARASRDRKLPQTVEDAVKLVEKAKADVEAELRQFRPKKKVTTVDGGSSTNSLPEPKDTKDVIRRALSQ